MVLWNKNMSGGFWLVLRFTQAYIVARYQALIKIANSKMNCICLFLLSVQMKITKQRNETEKFKWSFVC